MEIVNEILFLGISIAMILQEVQIKKLIDELFYMKNVIGMLSQMIPEVKDAKKFVSELEKKYGDNSETKLQELDSEDLKTLCEIFGIDNQFSDKE